MKQIACNFQSLAFPSSLEIIVGTKTQILNCNLASNQNEMRGSKKLSLGTREQITYHTLTDKLLEIFIKQV